MKQFLIADYDPQVRRFLSELIQRAIPGSYVMQAQNGKEVLMLAIAERPDLILLCDRLPILNGYETAYELRRMPRTQAIPLLALVDETTVTPTSAGVRRLAEATIPRRPQLGEFEVALRTVLPGLPLGDIGPVGPLLATS